MATCRTCRDRDDCSAWDAVQSNWPEDLREKFGCTCWEAEPVEFDGTVQAGTWGSVYGTPPVHFVELPSAFHSGQGVHVRITPL